MYELAALAYDRCRAGFQAKENAISSLDSTELMHMAIHASANGRPDDSVRTLRELLEKQPDNAEAHFLLAADYAEIALLDKAVAHYQQSLQIKPDLDLARMQLALLHTAMDNLTAATTVLEPFISADPPSYFTDFANGLSRLFVEDLSGAREHLVAGIGRNTDNAELNADMRNLVTTIDEASGNTGSTEGPSTDHLLSAYNKRH